MISHSPPVFSHSPPVGFLSEYMSTQNLPFCDSTQNRSCRPQSIKPPSQQNISRNGLGIGRMTSAPEFTFPPKSCLITRHSDNQTQELEIQKNETNRATKKRVIFADDHGLSLIEVRIMSEPSNVPPHWSMKFLEQITQGLVSPHPADQWTVDFKQPASDYLSFRNKIDSKFVSLENVIVKDDESIIFGTVKVKNISFQKEVIVRTTWNDWKSQQDIFCTYSKIYSPSSAAHVIYDTFSFKITLPPSSKKLEFCICFRADGKEYWDNNDNKNYAVSKRSPFYYQALGPYDKNKSRNCSPTITKFAVPERTDDSSDTNWNVEPSPYW